MKKRLTMSFFAFGKEVSEELSSAKIVEIWTLLSFSENNKPEVISEKIWAIILRKMKAITRTYFRGYEEKDVLAIPLLSRPTTTPKITLGFRLIFNRNAKVEKFVLENRLVSLKELKEVYSSTDTPPIDDSVRKKIKAAFLMSGLISEKKPTSIEYENSCFDSDGKLSFKKLGYSDRAVGYLSQACLTSVEDFFSLGGMLSVRLPYFYFVEIKNHTLRLEQNKVFAKLSVEALKNIVICKKTFSGSERTFGHDFIFGRKFQIYRFCVHFKVNTLGELSEIADQVLFQSVDSIQGLGYRSFVSLINRLVELGLREDKITLKVAKKSYHSI